MLNQRNTKMQGTVGVATAILHYASLGFVVSVPLNDSQGYDLVVDKPEGLCRVQVKTTRFSRTANGSFAVGLKQAGGSRERATSKKFTASEADLVFVVTPTGNYEIPATLLDGKGCIHVGPTWGPFKV